MNVTTGLVKAELVISDNPYYTQGGSGWSTGGGQVNQTSFYLWRRKLKSERKQNSIGSNELLVEISLAETETIRIQLPGGATAFVPNQSESLLPFLHSLVDLDSDS